MLTGCLTRPQTTWCLRYTPTTNVERQLVATELRTALQQGRGSVTEAYKVACEMWCRPTVWEWSDQQYGWTGRWRELR